MQSQTNNNDSTATEEQKTYETIRELDFSISDNESVKLPMAYFSA